MRCLASFSTVLLVVINIALAAAFLKQSNGESDSHRVVPIIDPEDIPPVFDEFTVVLGRGESTVRQVLDDICEQSGWTLRFDDDQFYFDRRILDRSVFTDLDQVTAAQALALIEGPPMTGDIAFIFDREQLEILIGHPWRIQERIVTTRVYRIDHLKHSFRRRHAVLASSHPLMSALALKNVDVDSLSDEQLDYELMDLIIMCVASEAWEENGGTAASIDRAFGLFIIRAAPSVHNDVEAFLTALQRSLGR